MNKRNPNKKWEKHMFELWSAIPFWDSEGSQGGFEVIQGYAESSKSFKEVCELLCMLSELYMML